MSLGTGSTSGVSIVHDAHGRMITTGFTPSEPAEIVSRFVGGADESEAWIANSSGEWDKIRKVIELCGTNSQA
ncbi:MAG: hypothetical protein U0791_02955 [Gemmataceae bacterium]